MFCMMIFNFFSPDGKTNDYNGFIVRLILIILFSFIVHLITTLRKVQQPDKVIVKLPNHTSRNDNLENLSENNQNSSSACSNLNDDELGKNNESEAEVLELHPYAVQLYILAEVVFAVWCASWELFHVPAPLDDNSELIFRVC